MTELHLYIADDGTEFEDEEECLRHEAGCRAQGLKGIVLLDENFRPIPLSDLSQWENAWFIYAKDIQALRDLSDVWDWDLTGVAPPRFLFADTPGLFAYDGTIDEWYHMGTRLQEIQSAADQAMKTINDNL